MLGDWLISSPWPALALGLLLTGLDLALTVWAGMLYHAGAKDSLELHGQYVLEQLYEPRAGWRQFWTRRYSLFLLGTAVAIPAAWYVISQLNRLDWAFVFIAGGLLLYELTEILHQARVVTLFRLLKKKAGFEGHLEVQRLTSLNLNVIDQYGMAVVYLIAFLTTGSIFFLGGAAFNFIFGHKVRDLVASRQKMGMRV